MDRGEFLYAVSSLVLPSCIVKETVIPPVHYHYTFTFQPLAEPKPAKYPLETIVEKECPQSMEEVEKKQNPISPEYRALLDTIAWAEGTDCHYNMMVGRMLFKNYAAHPVKTGEMPKKGFPFTMKRRGKRGNRWITYGVINYSTAAGRYQFLYKTYTILKEKGLFTTGFAPEEQDQAALHLITESGVTAEMLKEAIQKKDFVNIWHQLSGEWASLPDKKTKRSKHRQFAYKEDQLEYHFFYFYEIHTTGQ